MRAGCERQPSARGCSVRGSSEALECGNLQFWRCLRLLIPTPDAIPDAVSTARRALDLATKRQDDSLVVRMKASPGRSEGLARAGCGYDNALTKYPGAEAFLNGPA